jgi:hypothetical protein
MKRIIILFLGSTLFCISSANAEKKSEKIIKGEKMKNNNVDSMPFGLNKSDLANVEVVYGFYSSKTGAGEQKIILTGNGKVQLYLTRAYNAKPEIKDGRLSSDVFLRLLDIMEEENIFGLEDRYPSVSAPHGRRIMRLTLPGRIKNISLEESVSPEFERIAGAVKLAAGVALPESLKQNFFPNL